MCFDTEQVVPVLAPPSKAGILTYLASEGLVLFNLNITFFTTYQHTCVNILYCFAYVGLVLTTFPQYA